MKFVPIESQTVMVEGAAIPVPTGAYFISVDIDGEVKAWIQCRKPYLVREKYWTPNLHDPDDNSIRIGMLENESGEVVKMTPVIFDV